MATLHTRPHSALVVIDAQNGVVADAHDRDAVVANIATPVDKARAATVPVVWVHHAGDELAPCTAGWAYVAELAREADEPLVANHYGDAFEDTEIESVLTGLGAGHLVVAGAQTDACIRCTLHGAFTRGYDVTLVGDAHTTSDHSACGAPPPNQVIAHTNLYWQHQDAPGRHGGTVSTEEVCFA